MQSLIRDFAQRVQRGERWAVVVAAFVGALGVLVGGPGGHAYLEVPCSPLASPAAEAQRVTDRMAIVERVEAEPSPSSALPEVPLAPAPSPMPSPRPRLGAPAAPSAYLRGPPRS